MGFPRIIILHFPDWWDQDIVGRGGLGFGAGSGLLKHRTDHFQLSFLIWKTGINEPHRPLPLTDL